MNKDEFSKKLSNIEELLTDSQVKEILINSLSPETESKFRGYNNMIIAIEEFAECSKEITKVLRGKPDKVHLIEELADVQLSIMYIQEICQISDSCLKKAISVKMNRVNDTLKKYNKWE